MKTAVIYARYSSDSQTEQSIEGQLRVCQQYAQNNDIVILDTYIDRAMTGTNDLRPDFQRMIKDSNKKQWNYVLVYKLDRFSRDKYEMTIHKHTLKNNGVKVISAMENIPEGPEGIILESMLEGMNQYYSAELSQKVLRGLNESYIKGLFTGGHQIYGYDVKDKKSVVNLIEAEVVKEIFNKFANGYTAVDIAKELKARGIRTKKGTFINASKIYKIIANTKYIGKTVHRGNVYYVAASFYHILCKYLSGQERCEEVEFEDEIHAAAVKVEETLDVGVLYIRHIEIVVGGSALGIVAARSVYEKVAFAEIFVYRNSHLFHAFFFEAVYFISLCNAAVSYDFVRNFLSRVEIEVEHGYLRAALCVFFCYLAAQDAACAGDDYHFVFIDRHILSPYTYILIYCISYLLTASKITSSRPFLLLRLCPGDTSHRARGRTDRNPLCPFLPRSSCRGRDGRNRRNRRRTEPL